MSAESRVGELELKLREEIAAREEAERLLRDAQKAKLKDSMNICWNIEVWAVQKHVNLVDLVKELSNEYLLAKFGFDTAENEPLKVCLILPYLPRPEI